MKRCVPAALKARPFAPNGGKPWLPGVSRSCDTNVDTGPAGRTILDTLPPKESETERLPAAANANAFSPQPPPAPPQTPKDATRPPTDGKGGRDFRTFAV